MRVTIENNGVVVNVIEADSLASAQALYPNLIVSDTPASIGWISDGLGGYTEPSVYSTKEELIERLASYRWEVETGGVSIGGTLIETTREAQAQISSTYSALKDGLVSSVKWKAVSGWVTLNLQSFTPIAQAVAVHVQKCFEAEQAVYTLIENLSDSEVNTFDVETSFDTALASIV